MSNTAIKVENLSKIYRLGEIGTGTISRDMERWFKTKVLKQEDPFLKIGESNDRASKGNSDIVYSLRDINFEINQGDAVGIIGRNGAGKSTLLKILSRVTTPTTGRINIKGRVASLLEVGTGFHPELTGRENIYLNGAILGMRKREIDRKLDEIIDFSGVERYIDTPVKRYSSGMYVRLAFAVAAHLESEILIVDEVLAVGDAEFQKKCLGKMGEVSKGEGRTVLFVSHNMAAVQSLCNSGVLLSEGKLILQSNVADVINNYNKVSRYLDIDFDSFSNEHINLIKIYCLDDLGLQRDTFSMDESFNIVLEFDKKSDLQKSYLHVLIKDEYDSVIIEFDSLNWKENIFSTDKQGLITIKLRIIERLLNRGEFNISIGLSSDLLPTFQIISISNIYCFQITNGLFQRDLTKKSISSYVPIERIYFQDIESL
jgi:lipopolysaccharide transport system ATP-binding protein